MVDTFLQTKLYRPPSQPDLVKRPRLLAQMKAKSHTKLILVSAPAGYGKTTFVSEWLAQLGDVHIGWVSLDEDDSDPQQFFQYLLAAIRPFLGAESTLAHMLQFNQPDAYKGLVKAWVNDAATIPHPIYLVLDDYHTIDTADVDAALALLLEWMPPHITLVMTSRSDPGFPISRLRARGQLIELRADALRFTHVEAAEFLQQGMGLTLTTHQIAALEARTEGWIAGLQMAALSMQNRVDVDSFVDNFTGSYRFIMDYLVEEVFNQQPPPVQQFLRQTAVLNRFNAEICDAVCQQDDSEQLLRYIEEHNLFLIPLDDRRYWYRYHHLFADFFRAQWHKQDKLLHVQLHGRASDWFADNELLREAFFHAEQANDPQRIARLLLANASTLIQDGRFIQLRKWLALLPTATIQADSILFMTHLWVETTLRSAERDERQYAAAQHVVEHDPTLDEAVRHYLLAQIDAMRALFAVNQNRAEEALLFGERALAALPANETRVRQTVNLQLGHVLRARGEFGDALAAYLKVLDQGERVAFGLSYYLALCHVLRFLRLSNRLAEAAALSEKSVTQQHQPAESSPLHGLVLVEMATLQFVRGHFEEALALSKRAIPLCEQIGFGESIAYAHHTHACIYLLQQQPQLAQEAHNAVQALMRPLEGHAITAVKHIMALRFARLQGKSAKLDRLLTNKPEGAALSADLKVELNLEIAWAYLAQGQPTGALAMINGLRRTYAGEADFWAVSMQLLTGAAYQLLNQPDEAQSALNEGLRLAVPQGNKAPFFMGGEPVKALLETAYHRLEQPLQRFVDDLFTIWGTAVLASPSASNSADQPGLVDPLSARELEILQLIADGLKNKEIADQLFISHNTVLFHNKNIFGKLGVSRRTAAVSKARVLGLV